MLVKIFGVFEIVGWGFHPSQWLCYGEWMPHHDPIGGLKPTLLFPNITMFYPPFING